MFRGTYTALITPFRDGEIDEAALDTLVEEQIQAGIDGLVPCGSTGESATLSHSEHERVIRAVIEKAAGRVKVIAGTGSNNTAEACRLTKFAADAGADAALLISPYYNKPTQRGHIEHYTAVAEASGLPILIYNIPGRTGVDIAPETIAALAKVPNVVGLKAANGSIDHACRVIELTDDDFCVLSGDDSMTLAFMSVGAVGVIGVTPNLLPERFKAMVDAATTGNFEEARRIHYELFPLMRATNLETNPIPVKTAMAALGRCAEEFRLPLTKMEPETRALLMAQLAALNLVPSP